MPLSFQCIRKTCRAFWIKNSFLLICAFIIAALTTYHRLDSINFWGIPRHIGCDRSPFSNSLNRFSGPVSEDVGVPNIVHFIRFGANATCFTEEHAFCIVAAHENQKPDRILIHTDNVEGVKDSMQKISLLEENNVQYEVLYYPHPTHVFGMDLSETYKTKHATDFTKLKVLRKYGGIFLDNDVYLAKPLGEFLRYEITLMSNGNSNHETKITDDMIIAHRDARFLDIWLKTYHWYQTDVLSHLDSAIMLSSIKNNIHLANILKTGLQSEKVVPGSKKFYDLKTPDNTLYLVVLQGVQEGLCA